MSDEEDNQQQEDAGAGDQGTGGQGAGDQGAGDQNNSAPETTWGSDWRETMLGDDLKDHSALLQRVPTPQALAKNYVEAQAKIRAGLKPMELSADADESQVSLYRELNGIPATAAEYKIDPAEGVTIPEADKDFIDHMLGKMHESHIRPDHANAMVNSFYAWEAQQEAAQIEKDNEAARELNSTLQDEWGTDHRANMMALDNFLSRLPADLQPLFKDARLADGSKLFNSPEFLRSAVEWERSLNPTSTLYKSDANPVASLQAEMKQIETFMRDNRQAYNKDAAMQARHRELIAAEEQMKRAS